VCFQTWTLAGVHCVVTVFNKTRKASISLREVDIGSELKRAPVIFALATISSVGTDPNFFVDAICRVAVELLGVHREKPVAD